MEPVSLGVGIAGAISASISIGTALKKLTHQYRDAPDSYTFTIKQCSAVNGQLALLQGLMLKETWSKQLGNDGETSDYFVTIVMNCAENLQELESCVGHIRLGLLDVDGRGLNARQKAKMVWKDDDIKTLLGRLEISKEDIGRVLSILQMDGLARMESQMEQLRISMNALSRSKTTKYRAMRVPGGSIGGSESSVVVVPSTYPGAPPMDSVSGSRVSLSDIDLSSMVLTTMADERVSNGPINTARNKRMAESIRSFFPMAEGGAFGGQMKALVELVEQDRAGMQQQLSKAEKSLVEQSKKVQYLEKALQNRQGETDNDIANLRSEFERKHQLDQEIAEEKYQELQQEYHNQLDSNSMTFNKEKSNLADEITELKVALQDANNREFDWEKALSREKKDSNAKIDEATAYHEAVILSLRSDMTRRGQETDKEIANLSRKCANADEAIQDLEYEVKMRSQEIKNRDDGIADLYHDYAQFESGQKDFKDQLDWIRNHIRTQADFHHDELHHERAKAIVVSRNLGEQNERLHEEVDMLHQTVKERDRQLCITKEKMADNSRHYGDERKELYDSLQKETSKFLASNKENLAIKAQNAALLVKIGEATKALNLSHELHMFAMNQYYNGGQALKSIHAIMEKMKLEQNNQIDFVDHYDKNENKNKRSEYVESVKVLMKSLEGVLENGTEDGNVGSLPSAQEKGPRRSQLVEKERSDTKTHPVRSKAFTSKARVKDQDQTTPITLDIEELQENLKIAEEECVVDDGGPRTTYEILDDSMCGQVTCPEKEPRTDSNEGIEVNFNKVSSKRNEKTSSRTPSLGHLPVNADMRHAREGKDWGNSGLRKWARKRAE